MKRFFVFAVLLFLADIIVENINGRFTSYDFQVYVGAANSLLNHTPVYGISFGLPSGFFKYSPFTLMCFLPSTYLTFQAASIIHFILISLATLGLFQLMLYITQSVFKLSSIKNLNGMATIVLVIVLNHLVREFHLGNVNVLMLFGLLVGMYFISMNQFVVAGFLLAFLILVKPFFMLLLLPFAFAKQFKLLLFTAGAMVLFILVTCLFYGSTLANTLWFSWVKAMAAHNNYLFSNHTLQSILKFWFGLTLPLPFWVPFVMVAMVYFFYRSITVFYFKEAMGLKNSFLDGFILLAALPNLLITDTEHFIWSFPLLFLMTYQGFLYKNWVQIICFTIGAILYGINSTDLLGHKLSDMVELSGCLGIGNMCIIFLTMGYRYLYRI